MSIRIEKINDLIRDNLSMLFQREISFKRGVFVSVSTVSTSPDFKYARVYLSVFPEKERAYAIKTIQYEIGKLQKKLNRTLKIKTLPKLEFAIENKQEKFSKIEELIKQIKEENQ